MLDESTKYEMAKMMANMESLYPGWLDPQSYNFSGQESLSYSEALKLMEHLQKMDRLEEQFQDSRHDDSLDEIDEKLVKELLGDSAAEELKRMREITKMLEEAGYIRKKHGRVRANAARHEENRGKSPEHGLRQLKERPQRLA